MNKNYLVLVDMQNDFLGGCLSVPDFQKVIDENVSLFENFCFDKVICTLDTHYDNYATTKEGRHLPTPHCIQKTNGHKLVKAIYDALYSQPNVDFVKKHKFAPGQKQFYDKFLDFDSVSDKIFICGVCTDICVVSTAFQLSSMFPETEIYLIEPCCAGTNKENHEHAVHVMQSCQINIVKDFDELKNNHARLRLLKLNY